MIVFCILAHQHPQALTQLLEKLENFKVVVHLDKGVDIEGFKKKISSKTEVEWLADRSRIRTNWGGWSIVQAQLELLKFAVARFPNLTNAIFLSGECFPIYPLKKFAHFISKNDYAINFRKIQDIGSLIAPNQFLLNRVARLNPMDFRIFPKYKKRESYFYKICGFPSKIIRLLHLPNPSYNRNANYFFGSQWIALNMKQIQFLLQSEEKIRDEFRFSYAPDEIAFHTILARSSLADSMISVPDPIQQAPFHLIHTDLSSRWTLEEFLDSDYSSSWFIRRPSHEIIKYLETYHGV